MPNIYNLRKKNTDTTITPSQMTKMIDTCFDCKSFIQYVGDING